MLYFGDFDPSGVEMLNAMKETLEGELDMPGITFKRIALTKNDIFNYHLPHNPDALKKSDTRAKKHLENYCELAVNGRHARTFNRKQRPFKMSLILQH